MRPSTLVKYAQEAGFLASRSFRSKNDLWRFYRLIV